MTSRSIRVGLLGCGTVGSAVVRLIRGEATDIERRSGVRLEVSRVAVRDPARPRDVDLHPGALTVDPAEVVHADDVDIVCEVMGGTDPARSLILDALSIGKPVVTANK